LQAIDARGAFRVVHFTLQSNHIHFLLEASDARALSRGMQGLCVRIARRLNRSRRRAGPLFADHYHARALKTPREVRNALVYVLNNARKHGARDADLDPYSSARWFDGWRELEPASEDRMTSVPRTWLLSVGWRRHGEIRVLEAPALETRPKRATKAPMPRRPPHV
jgi:hypothetical protein